MSRNDFKKQYRAHPFEVRKKTDYTPMKSLKKLQGKVHSMHEKSGGFQRIGKFNFA
jgi:hypothetical protein